jgi:hypothetical protein
MIRKLTLCLLIVTLALTVRAQDEEEEPKKGFDKEKLFYGGNFGLGFGSNSTNINISPQVGYRFNKFLAAGAGVNFVYASYKYDWLGYKENYGVAGLNIFGRVYPIQYILVQLQPELNYVWGKIKYNGGAEDAIDSRFVPSLLGGAGAAIPLGQRGALLVMVQYDILQRYLNPYGEKPFLTIGFNF